MFKLDDNFLKELGLDQLPENQKQAFLEQVYSTLEERVGIQLSEGLTDDQLEEFEGIIDRNESKISSWLEKFVPDYKNQEDFQKIQQATGLYAEDTALKAEYAATKWLEVNRPNYREVVSKTMQDLKEEIASNRDKIVD